MLREQRQEQLIKMLEKHGIMRVSDLSDRLNSSAMTIRRDLKALEVSGVVKRLHGGVKLAVDRPDKNQPSFYERLEAFDVEKDRIGEEAASRVKKGSIVFLDAGTTPLAMVKYLPDDISFTAITTGLLTAVALCDKPNISVISIGGNVHDTSFSSVNYMAVDMIRSFHADIAFISTKAVCLPEGTFEAQLPLIEVKRSMVESAERVILLADHSKFNVKSLCHAIHAKDIDEIITDSQGDSDMINLIEEAGIKVTVV